MAGLVDYRGRPVKTAGLRREQSTGGVTSIRSPFDPEVARGLTPEKLGQVLHNAKNGDHHEYLSLAREMEQRDPHYYSTLQTRKLSIFALDAEVHAASDSSDDEKIAEEVRRFIKSESFQIAILDILDALGKGFSVTEIMWDTSELQWSPVAYKHRNPTWFNFDQDTYTELRLDDGSPDGAQLDPFKYIIYQPKIVSGLSLAGGLARIVAALHVFKGYAIKDWMSFAEVFGMPIRIGKYHEGATEEQKDALRDAVQNIGSDAAAIVPGMMEIIFERANASGNAGADGLFAALGDWLNKETSKAVLGQTMTVEDGSSLAQASIHNEVRIDIRNSDALQFTNIIGRDLIKPFGDLNFGVRARKADYPRYTLDTEEPEDLVALATSLVPFINLGLPVKWETIWGKFGLPEVEPGEENILKMAAPEAPEEGEEDGGGADARMSALKTWLDVESRKSTNMRTFRKALTEKLEQ